MTDTFNYALKKNQTGNYVIESTVTSFNLNQVVEKDVVSFYKHFSTNSSFDTGLLPLDGTGILSVRSAGHHMQIAIQHKPGCYHINWGDHESDRHAKTYYLAQPYRIVIGDFVNGNLLGAKMFYSPVPITHPNQPLYHVNLPNINCKGYRGNAVGWICLYHKEDWSNLSFNQKVSNLIERCSGVETYNDANMSETDGPRFYQEIYSQKYTSNYSNYSYLWDPNKWQTKTEDEGFVWTLDESLWIPVLVKDMDTQDKHYQDGQPFTFTMAILGNYAAYYNDSQIPKLYNLVARNDLSLTNSEVASMFKAAFSSAPALFTSEKKDNPYEYTVAKREENSSETFQPSLNFSDDPEDDEDMWVCYSCENQFGGQTDSNVDVDGNSVCSDCSQDHYVYLDTPGELYPLDHEAVIFADNLQVMIHSEYDSWAQCSFCKFLWAEFGKGQKLPVFDLSNPYMKDGDAVDSICPHCIEQFAHENGYSGDLGKCAGCETTVINLPSTFNKTFNFVSYVSPTLDSNNQVSFSRVNLTYCNSCQDKMGNSFVCPCGLLADDKTKLLSSCKLTKASAGQDGEINADVTSCCKGCIGNFELTSDGDMIGSYVPFNKELFEYNLNTYDLNSKFNSHGIKVSIDYDKVKF